MQHSNPMSDVEKNRAWRPLYSALDRRTETKTTRHQQRELGQGRCQESHRDTIQRGQKSDEKLLIYFFHVSVTLDRGGGLGQMGHQQPWAPLLSLHLHQRPALMQLK